MNRLLVLFIVVFISTEVKATNISMESVKKEAEKFLDLNFTNYNSLIAYSPELSDGLLHTWVYPKYIHHNQDGFFSLKPNSSFHLIARTDTEIIYNTQNTIDQYGRRVTVDSSKEQNTIFKKGVVFAGCSWTFGYGLSDDETIPAFFSSHQPRLDVKNWGTPGSSINLALYDLKLNSKQLHSNDLSYDYIYILINSHLERSAGTYPSMLWMSKTPYYKKNTDGRMVFNGSISQNLDWKFFILNLYKKIVGFLPSFYHERVFPRLSSIDHHYICDLFVEMKRSWLESFPSSRFIIYHHPLAYQELSPDLISCLESHQVSYVKGNQEYFSGLKTLTIKYDGHPTSITNERVAFDILKNLF